MGAEAAYTVALPGYMYDGRFFFPDYTRGAESMGIRGPCLSADIADAAMEAGYGRSDAFTAKIAGPLGRNGRKGHVASLACLIRTDNGMAVLIEDGAALKGAETPELRLSRYIAEAILYADCREVAGSLNLELRVPYPSPGETVSSDRRKAEAPTILAIM